MIDKSEITLGRDGRERAIAVGVVVYPETRETVEDHLEELELLADTAGADVIERVIQTLPKQDVTTFIGKGKAEEIAELAEEEDASLVIVDDDLSPVQIRNLEQIIERKVIDRSGLILDIFARRARTREARTQVELAQLLYLMPRLTRMWTHLSKQYGGIGTKGPGETQIETDRRIIKTRIASLREKLEKIETQRETQRKGRQEMYRVSLVGYTNAGKSTMMNEISDAAVHAEDRLFATLDTVVRSVELPNGRPILLSDTVGFIRKLPPNLIASFRSTLAEARESDLLLHVVDASSPNMWEQIEVVEETLKEIGAEDVPVLMVMNKADLIAENKERQEEIRARYPDASITSAAKGFGVGNLIDRITERVEESYREEVVKVEMARYHDVARLHDLAEVTETHFGEEFAWLRFRYSPKREVEIESLLSRAEAEKTDAMPIEAAEGQ